MKLTLGVCLGAPLSALNMYLLQSSLKSRSSVSWVSCLSWAFWLTLTNKKYIQMKGCKLQRVGIKPEVLAPCQSGPLAHTAKCRKEGGGWDGCTPSTSRASIPWFCHVPLAGTWNHWLACTLSWRLNCISSDNLNLTWSSILIITMTMSLLHENLILLFDCVMNLDVNHSWVWLWLHLMADLIRT